MKTELYSSIEEKIKFLEIDKLNSTNQTTDQFEDLSDRIDQLEQLYNRTELIDELSDRIIKIEQLISKVN